VTPTADDVIAAARTWVRTPYHHMARVKGHGVDCAKLIIAAFVESGVNEDFDPGFYTPDWHHHRSQERYLEFIERYMVQIDQDWNDEPFNKRIGFVAPPASVVVIKLGRTFSHSALVTEWPNVIHANVHDGCVVECTAKGSMLEDRAFRTYAHRSLLT
jgi:cell wall-associated NlpC family hydrolase